MRCSPCCNKCKMCPLNQRNNHFRTAPPVERKSDSQIDSNLQVKWAWLSNFLLPNSPALQLALFSMQHHVYFWIKEEFQTEEKLAAFEAGLQNLFSIPQITGGGWGKPAAVVERPVTVNSYTYCLYQSFDSLEDHNIYQDAEAHLTFINSFKEIWAQVQVMDCE